MADIKQWLPPKTGVSNPPWTLHGTKSGSQSLKPASEYPEVEYPKPDGRITSDRLSSVSISNMNHEENQSAHLTLRDSTVPTCINLTRFAGPE